MSRDEPALKLWRHIFGGERGLLCIWTAVRDEDGNLIKPKSANFHYPKAASAAAQWALEQSDKGREVYFCAHLLMGPERRKENASAVHALWFEKDGGQMPNGHLTPSAVVESSPGRYHGYLRLTDAIPPEVAEALNKRLAHAAGADPSGADRTQLLRVPETVNHKYSERPVVKVRRLEDSSTRTPAELEEVLPHVETAKRSAPEVGERISSGGRNNELTSIGGTLRRRGLEEEEIAAALLAVNERRCDPPLGEAEVRTIAHSVAGYKPATPKPAYDSNNSNDSNDSVFQDLADLPDPEEFPIAALPITLRQFVREAAASVGCPVDYVGLSALAAASAAIGDTRRIALKKDWTEGAAIFGMIVGGPASKKSPAMNLALRPVRERQMALKTEYERQKEEYKVAYANYANALKDDPDAREPDKPTLRRTYADDTTVERLADILKENRRGLLIIKDELSAWLGSMNQYKQGGKGADRQFWLSAHTNQPVSVDRKSLEEPVIVARPFVSIVGGIQPEVLPDFGKDRGDGLIDRFTPVYPKPQIGRWTDDEISDHVREEYARTIGSLYKLRHAGGEEDPFPSRVSMTDEAKALFVAEYNRLHDELEAPGFPQRLRPAWGKLEAYLARFALIIAMTRIAELDDSNDTNDSDFREFREKVTSEDMAGAAKLLRYFKNHVRRVYTGLYGDSPSDRLAADLRDFLIAQGGAWEGIASELYDVLVSEHKPERPEDLAKAVRGIAKRTPLLQILNLKRTQDRRPFRLTLRNAVIADSAVMLETDDARAGL
jgi:hypothetical protein